MITWWYLMKAKICPLLLQERCFTIPEWLEVGQSSSGLLELQVLKTPRSASNSAQWKTIISMLVFHLHESYKPKLYIVLTSFCVAIPIRYKYSMLDNYLCAKSTWYLQCCKSASISNSILWDKLSKNGEKCT